MSEFPLIEQDTEQVLDLSGVITHECVCGSTWWNLQVTFHEYEIGSYLTVMQCAKCGTDAQAPTLLDSPEFQAWRAATPDDIPNRAYQPDGEFFGEQ
jgi:hypothetical protein